MLQREEVDRMLVQIRGCVNRALDGRVHRWVAYRKDEN